MHKALLVSAFSLAFVNTATAQDYHGGFGNFFCGPVYNISSSLENKLGSDALLGDNLQLNATTFAYGGAGYSVRPKGFVIGGSGYFYNVTATGYDGKAELNVSQGFFNIGYRVLNKKSWMGFPYMGFGAFGSNFRITNTTSDKVFLLGSDSVYSLKTAKYSTGGMAFDMGLSLKYFVTSTPLKSSAKCLKTSIGIDVGASFCPSFEKWKNVATREKITSMTAPFIMSVYTRVSIGFGIFNSASKGKMPQGRP